MRTVLVDARLPDRPDAAVDVVVVDGVVVEVVTHDPTRATAADPGTVREDVGGLLLLGAPAEPHAHLDKALSAERVPNPTGDLSGAVDAWLAARPHLEHDDLVLRATAAVRLALVHGHTAMRTHVDVGDGIGLRALEALLDVRAAVADRLDLQVVLFATSPLTGVEGAGNLDWMRRAMELPVDVIGGCPALDARPDAVIALCLDAAEQLGLPVDLHVDESLDPGARCLDALAHQVLDRGFALPVTASHCVSLAMRPVAEQRRTAAVVAEAGIGVVALPQTNLYLQGRDHPVGTPRGITAVAVLRDAGVTVAAGGDNVQDPFNLVGRGDPLETASLLVAAAHHLPDDAYRAVSADAREVLGLPAAGTEPGQVADLLAVDAPSVRAAVAGAPMTRRTYRQGRPVARSDWRAELL
jgi:cytosine/creatinine deaminase